MLLKLLVMSGLSPILYRTRKAMHHRPVNCVIHKQAMYAGCRFVWCECNLDNADVRKEVSLLPLPIRCR